MEIRPGVFVSSTSTDDWTPDTASGADTHVVAAVPGAFLGISRYLDRRAPISWTTGVRESVLVLEGSVRIDLGDGELTLRPGDIASFPAGLAMTWRFDGPFKEVWFVAEPS